MELLKPLQPHHAPILCLPFHGHPSSSQSQSQLPLPMPRKVHVAVGKSIDKAVTLLQWALNHFQNAEIVILHVYQPSLTIPTLCKLVFLSIFVENFGLLHFGLIGSL